MKTLYFDLFAGISGDMTLGALIDLGVDFEWIRNRLAELDVTGYTLECRRVIKGGIAATRFAVHLENTAPAGAGPLHDSQGDASHHHKPPLPQQHDHHHHPPQAHRSFSDIRQLLTTSSLPPAVVERAVSIFQRLAKAEGKIHGVPAEAVTFHEIGAVDSIVDITGIALALDRLGVERFACSRVNVGNGTVECAHGVLPVPAPATTELLRGFPVYSAHFSGELVTPTGAAVLRALVTAPGELPAGSLKEVGYGAGSRDVLGGANVLRLLLLEEEPSTTPPGDTRRVSVIECNLDDMSPELIGDLQGELLRSGALDVFITPIQMKKSRPGVLLSLLCRPAETGRLAELVLERTTTFGIRFHTCEREELERRPVKVDTVFGPIEAKAGLRGGRLLKVAPEYEACRQLSSTAGRPLVEVYREVERAIAAQWEAIERQCGVNKT